MYCSKKWCDEWACKSCENLVGPLQMVLCLGVDCKAERASGRRCWTTRLGEVSLCWHHSRHAFQELLNLARTESVSPPPSSLLSSFLWNLPDNHHKHVGFHFEFRHDKIKQFDFTLSIMLLEACGLSVFSLNTCLTSRANCLINIQRLMAV